MEIVVLFDVASNEILSVGDVFVADVAGTVDYCFLGPRVAFDVPHEKEKEAQPPRGGRRPGKPKNDADPPEGGAGKGRCNLLAVARQSDPMYIFVQAAAFGPGPHHHCHHHHRF